MNDDLNAPRAVAALFDFVREANRLLDGSKSAGPELRTAWEWAGQVLDVAAVGRSVDVALDASVVFEESATGRAARREWAAWWKDRRVEAKKGRNFKLADEIRDRLKANGFEIRDTKEGSEVVRIG